MKRELITTYKKHKIHKKLKGDGYETVSVDDYKERRGVLAIFIISTPIVILMTIKQLNSTTPGTVSTLLMAVMIMYGVSIFYLVMTTPTRFKAGTLEELKQEIDYETKDGDKK